MKLSEEKVAKLVKPADRAQVIAWDSELHGFGVVVGAQKRTFIIDGRAPGSRAKVRRSIGVLGAPRPDGRAWTVQLARIEARSLLGKLADGEIAPRIAERTVASGPTLRDGMKLHVANMRKRGCSPRSIGTLESELPRLLPDWIERPIAELTGAELVKTHDKLTGDGKTYLANRLVAQVSAVWNALDRVHELDGRNPARAVTRNAYTPSRERVEQADMPGWLATVEQLSSVRRDLQLFCLFTGMRSEAARHVRWEHVDEDRGALVVPKPKGGEAKAFTLPLCQTVIDILKRRRKANASMFAQYKGGDAGWVFPTLTRATPHEVIPLSQPQEEDLPGPHTLRRTYLSVAAEAGISELDRHVLANHAYGRQNVNATYIEQAFDHLADCQATIERALWARLKPAPDAKAKRRRARMRAVP